MWETHQYGFIQGQVHLMHYCTSVLMKETKGLMFRMETQVTSQVLQSFGHHSQRSFYSTNQLVVNWRS